MKKEPEPEPGGRSTHKQAVFGPGGSLVSQAAIQPAKPVRAIAAG